MILTLILSTASLIIGAGFLHNEKHKKEVIQSYEERIEPLNDTIRPNEATRILKLDSKSIHPKHLDDSLNITSPFSEKSEYCSTVFVQINAIDIKDRPVKIDTISAGKIDFGASNLLQPDHDGVEVIQTKDKHRSLLHKVELLYWLQQFDTFFPLSPPNWYERLTPSPSHYYRKIGFNEDRPYHGFDFAFDVHMLKYSKNQQTPLYLGGMWVQPPMNGNCVFRFKCVSDQKEAVILKMYPHLTINNKRLASIFMSFGAGLICSQLTLYSINKFRNNKTK